MNQPALYLWERSLQAFKTAQRDLWHDPDASASRSYYAAFYAVSALFSLENKTFSRHSALEVAVHRDLIKAGKWPQKLGADYSYLLQLRGTGDYGGGAHVSREESMEALNASNRIIKAVHQTSPDLFTLPDDFQNS